MVRLVVLQHKFPDVSYSMIHALAPVTHGVKHGVTRGLLAQIASCGSHHESQHAHP